jgi:hypothetical protein
MRFALALRLLFASSILAISLSAMAGKYPYAEFVPTLAHETIEILKKHGMPVTHDRGNPWFTLSGIPGSYTLHFSQSDEIPRQAVLDVVQLCMDFYEQRGRRERFRIFLYRESREEWRKSLFLGIGMLAGVKPYFELTIGRREQ